MKQKQRYPQDRKKSERFSFFSFFNCNEQTWCCNTVFQWKTNRCKESTDEVLLKRKQQNHLKQLIEKKQNKKCQPWLLSEPKLEATLQKGGSTVPEGPFKQDVTACIWVGMILNWEKSECCIKFNFPDSSQTWFRSVLRRVTLYCFWDYNALSAQRGKEQTTLF